MRLRCYMFVRCNRFSPCCCVFERRFGFWEVPLLGFGLGCFSWSWHTVGWRGAYLEELNWIGSDGLMRWWVASWVGYWVVIAELEVGCDGDGTFLVGRRWRGAAFVVADLGRFTISRGSPGEIKFWACFWTYRLGLRLIVLLSQLRWVYMTLDLLRWFFLDVDRVLRY